MRDQRVSRGIYRTKYGWRLYVRIGKQLHPKRVHDPEHQLELGDLKARRDIYRGTLRAGRQTPLVRRTGPSTFADDARDRYLPAVRALPSYAERVYHIELWIAEFGPRDRATIASWEIAQVRDRWLTVGPKRICTPWPAGETPPGVKTGRWVEVAAPLSARQVNNRLRALENLYTVLDGRQAPNPVREAGEATEPEVLPRALAYDTIDALFEVMPDRGRAARGETRSEVSLTKLRLRVFAYTGFSHGELMGITEADLHLDGDTPWVWVRGRQKGKGTKGTAQPLTAAGAAALRALAEAGGLGPFSADSMRKSLARAARALNLPPLRPYDMRHSFATELLEKTGGNLSLTQMLMRQADPRTTLRYSAKAIDPVRLAGLRQAESRGAFGKSTPTLPRSPAPRAKKRKKR